jgi:exosortase
MPWAAIAWFTALLIAVYFTILARLVQQWSTDEDVGHGFFVPLVAGYIVWQRRDELLALRYRPSRWGWLVLAWGAAQSYLGSVGADLFLQRSAFLITIVGILLVLGGTPLLRALAFPLLLLPFMIPIPGLLYAEITFPLQLLASRIAEVALGLFDIPVLRDGNILELPSQKLSVAEACSGIRSLLSLSFLSLVYAYFFDSKVWIRWALLAATVPIAIIVNAGRVTLTGLLSESNPELAKGLFHSAEGWLVFLVALALMFATHRMLNWIWGRTQRHA